MPEETGFSSADSYEALQMGSQVVLLARGRRRYPGQIIALRKIARAHPDLPSPSEFSLVEEHPGAESVFPSDPFLAFGAFEAAEPIASVKVRDRAGVREVPVAQFPQGIQHGGATLDLPVVAASLPLDAVIARMKAADKRAVIVIFALKDYELIFNYQIADAYTGKIPLTDLRGHGHPVSIVLSAGLPTTRTRLFSMEQPGKFDVARVVSLFEDVTGAVRNAPKSCLCSSSKPSHTVRDSSPSLDQQPCPRYPPNHGILNCF